MPWVDTREYRRLPASTCLVLAWTCLNTDGIMTPEALVGSKFGCVPMRRSGDLGLAGWPVGGLLSSGREGRSSGSDLTSCTFPDLV